MQNLHLENTINQLLRCSLTFSRRERERFASVSSAVLLAGSTHQTQLAKWIHKPTNQTSRVVFLRRFLTSELFTQESVYQPLVTEALSTYHAPVWHLLIDRSPLAATEADLLMVSLAFRKRAIPLVWEVIRYGSTTATTQIALLKRVKPLIPDKQAVILHGDSEFGSVAMMQYLSQQTLWDFMLGQPSHGCYRLSDWTAHSVSDLNVTKWQPRYLSDIWWTKGASFGPLSLFGFYKPHRKDDYAHKIECRYITTSLPIAPSLRRLGHRRWGIEPMFRDYKSSGWQMDKSGLQHHDRRERLLLVLSFCYLWATSLGRWLCKSGRRHEIDSKKSVITVIFVLVGTGWFIRTK